MYLVLRMGIWEGITSSSSITDLFRDGGFIHHLLCYVSLVITHQFTVIINALDNSKMAYTLITQGTCIYANLFQNGPNPNNLFYWILIDCTYNLWDLYSPLSKILSCIGIISSASNNVTYFHMSGISLKTVYLY